MTGKLNIAFIGTGVMGRGMAGHLIEAGHGLTVYNRTQEKTAALVNAGACRAESVAEAVKGADAVITIVGYPKDVEEVYFEKGILEEAKQGAVLIDMTTSSPQLAERIAAAAAERGLNALDAPVSGGDVGAEQGTLSIMAGGDRGAFDRMLPVFELMGKQIVYQGPAGSGQHTKMANQIAIASNMMGVCEALYYAEKSGLDPKTVLESISGGAAGSWSLTNLAPRILKGDFAPGFYIKHFIKDMRIAIESAEEMGLALPGLKQAKALYDQLQEDGAGDLGTQALFKWYSRKK